MSAVVESAQRIGIEPDVLRAFKEVESGGAANAIRFEPHVFNNYRPDLIKQGKVPFTRSPGVVFSREPSETNKAAFERAYKLDPAAAVNSTSWGFFQVMGFNILKQHFGNNPARLVREFNADPERFSFRTVEFWFADRPKAVKAAQDKNWARLAFIYNGSDYAASGYHTKLRDAYNRISKTPGLVRQATGVAKKVPTWIYVAAPLSLITLAIIIRAARK